MAADAEALLRSSRRPLVIGMGGGGDVVGALATAEAMRLYDDAEPLVGGLTWERRPIDPEPGPRRVDEIEGAWELAPGVLLAGPHTRVRDREVFFGESRMAAFLGRPTVLIDIDGGPAAIADGLGRAITALDRDLTVFIDVGGDVLAQGDEPGLRSPLCDAVMLAVAERLAVEGRPVLLGVFGIGCDSELTAGEVLERISWVAGQGGLCGTRGLTEPVARRVEESLELVPTEASAQAVRAFRGVSGTVTIRGGARQFELTSLAAQTVFLDVSVTIVRGGAAGPGPGAGREPGGGQRRAQRAGRAHRARSRAPAARALPAELRPVSIGSRSMARAVGIPEPGGPEVLTVIERAVREPGEGEVRIAVTAAAVNPTDIGLCGVGAEGIDPPWTPGMDAAGTIESVGAGVDRLAPGDPVMAAVMPRRPEGGAQAALIVVPAASVVPVPEGASLERGRDAAHERAHRDARPGAAGPGRRGDPGRRRWRWSARVLCHRPRARARPEGDRGRQARRGGVGARLRRRRRGGAL